MARTRLDGLPHGKVASHLGVMLLVSAVLGVVVSGLAIPFAGVAGFTARNVAESVDELPQELETEHLPQRTELKDTHGKTIATLYDQNRVNVPLRQISRTMVEAMVAIEDYRFYQHGALDVKGTMRALFTNQAAGGVTQGGSSITQQLVKLTLLNQADTEEERKAAIDETYTRKLRELRYAIALEKRHSKDWILERYLNTAYFGDGAYGVQAAAQHYFNVNAKDLNVRQSALLAGLVQSPEAYNPVDNPAQAKVRRNVVLDRMAQLGVIKEEQAEKVKKRGLGLDPQAQPNGCVNSQAQFFCDYVVRYLMTDPSLGATPEERRRLIFSGGLTIKTTVDMRFQAAAQTSVESQVFKHEQPIGALALVEPGTGAVRGLAQSKPMGKGADQTFLNYTVPKKYGDANGFRPGSTFKSFVLAAAINQGISLQTRLSSPSPKSFDLGKFKTCDGHYQSNEIWSPKNSTGEGTFDLYTGTRQSINTFFVGLEQLTGLCEPYRLARRLGVQLNDPATQMTPAFTLGVADVSPLEMAEAYATFAARGVHCATHPVTQIADADGNVLKKYQKMCTQEIPGPVADAVNDVLRGVVEPGGFGQALNPGQAAAGKTGTTNDNMSVWFAGYTPNLAGASVVAGVNRAGSQVSLDGLAIGGYPRSSTSGSTTAGPIWGNAFKAIAQWLPDENFTPPSATDIRGALTPVPSVSGMTTAKARRTLEDAGFKVADGGMVDSSYSRGLVAYTAPGAGAETGAGDVVTLYISDGSPKPPPKPQPKPRDRDRDRDGGGGGDDRRGGGNGNGNGNGRGRD